MSTAFALACALLLPTSASAQHDPHGIIGVGAGGTFYSINTRADEGTVLTGVAAWGPIRFLRIEGTVRTHGCFDCDGDVLAEAGPQLYRPGVTWEPYIGAGAGYCFGAESVICDDVTGYVSLGSWIWLAGGPWGVRPDLRYRRVGSGDMGELSIAVGRRFPRGSSRP